MGFKEHAHPDQVLAYVRHQRLGEHGDPVLLSLSIANEQLASADINILHAKLKALVDASTGAIQHRRDKPDGPIQPRQYGLNFGSAQYDGQLYRPLGPHHVRKPRQFEPERISIQEENGSQRLVLSRGGDPVVNGEGGQECSDLIRSENARILQFVKPEEATDPVEIGLLGPEGQMPRAYARPHLLKELRRLDHPWLALCLS
jgi:hypothetical protein